MADVKDAMRQAARNLRDLKMVRREDEAEISKLVQDLEPEISAENE